MHFAIGLTMVAVTLGIHTFVAGWWLKFVAADAGKTERGRLEVVYSLVRHR